MTTPAIRRCDRETALVAALAACVSIISFWIYYHRGEILLYGDAIAHINIARRVFDSRTPGLLQLGTVWLPLPHLLMIPFLLSDAMWRTGVGGSIPSLIAYVVSVVGIFRLVRGTLSIHAPNCRTRRAAWIAAFIFAANPNLIYLQTTAMTEPLYLAFFIWTGVYLSEFVQQASARGSLVKCGLCLAGAAGTRYDGWFLAVVVCTVALIFVFRRKSSVLQSFNTLRVLLLLAAVVPALWISYNAIVYKNPLEFANGPYSAKGIEKKTALPGSPPHPGTSDLRMAANYFLKSAELNVVENNWHRLWLFLAMLGTATTLLFDRRLWPLLLLWTPLPFYMLSIAYSGVPIFIPPWWPYTIYNARYGVELLPAFAVFIALVVFWSMELARNRWIDIVVSSAAALLVVLSYASVRRNNPISFREGWINSRTRVVLESQMADYIADLPPDSTFLMYLGNHVGAVQQAGIRLRRVICEGNHRTWKQPFDPVGLWERALGDPEQYADFVIASDGDEVDANLNIHRLPVIKVIDVAGQPRVTIYQTHKTAQ